MKDKKVGIGALRHPLGETSVTKVIFLNGPPRSGKDTVAAFIKKRFHAAEYKFSEPLKNAIHALFGLDVPHEHYDSVKDVPLNTFFGHTPRDLYIMLSEDFMKPILGEAFLGEVALQLIIESRAKLIVISDSGFLEEAAVLIDHFGANNCLLVHLHRIGTSFKSDSRDYIKLGNVRTLILSNDDGLVVLEDKVIDKIHNWLEEKKHD